MGVRDGLIAIVNMRVEEVFHGESRARIVFSDGTVKVTVESSDPLPTNLNTRPGKLVDFELAYDT
jgi:hypothetical protein